MTVATKSDQDWDGELFEQSDVPDSDRAMHQRYINWVMQWAVPTAFLINFLSVSNVLRIADI